jgi:hypothetical protein
MFYSLMCYVTASLRWVLMRLFSTGHLF